MLNNKTPSLSDDKKDRYRLDPFGLIPKLRYQGKRSINSLAIVDKVDSTNDYLIRKKDLCETDFSLCIATQQSKGRGRRGREWLSPAGGNIYGSLAWKANGTNIPDHWYGLMIAFYLAQYLSSLSPSFVGVKWPNDLYCNGYKLGGILLEKVGGVYVVGLGLNVVTDEITMHDVITECISLKDIGVNLKPYPDIVASVVRHTCEAIDSVECQTPQQMEKLFHPFDLTYGKQVKVENGESTLSGVAMGVNHQGLLKLKTAKGITLCHSNECSVRL